MGITIHYSGRLDDAHVLPNLVLEAKQFARKRKWRAQEIDERIIGKVEHYVDTGPKTDIVKIKTEPIDNALRGIVIHPHAQSESISLTFNLQSELCSYMPLQEQGLYWENKLLFTKTQFAPLEVHIAICELLHLLKEKYFPSLDVSDEGEYFETVDAELLAEKLNFLNAAMGMLEHELSDPHSENKFAKSIRKAVDEADGKNGKRRSSKKGKLKVARGVAIKVRKPEWTRNRGTSATRN